MADVDYPGLIYLSRRVSKTGEPVPVLLSLCDLGVVSMLDHTESLDGLTIDAILFVRVAQPVPDRPDERSITIVKSVPLLENGDTTTAEKIVGLILKSGISKFKAFVELNAKF